MNALMMKLLGRVLMNEAQADGGQGGGADASAPAANAPAPAAEGSVLTPVATDAPPAADTKTPEQAQQEADAAKDKAEADAKLTGAPEAYQDFTLPDGMALDAEVLGEFKDFAKELNLPQEKAQKIVDFQTKLATKQAEEYQAAVTKQAQDWAAEVRNDPVLGGANYEKSVESAIKVIQSFGDPALTELLRSTGLGNNPALFKFCHRISSAISEDKFVLPGSQSSNGRKSDAEVFYGQAKS